MWSLFRSRSRRPVSSSLRVEGLESRWTPANITGVVVGGVLNLTADSATAAESMEIVSSSFPGSVGILAGMDTTVNGESLMGFKGVSSIKMNLKGGDDSVSLHDLVLSGSLTFNGGDGANNFTLSSSQIGGALAVSNGLNDMGLDVVNVNTNVLVGGATTIKNAGGLSFTEIYDNVRLSRGLTYTGAAGNDSFNFADSTSSGKLQLNLGGGMNDVKLERATFAEAVSVAAGSGADTVTINEATFGNSLSASLGNGDNAVRIDDYLGAYTSTVSTRIAGKVNLTTGTGVDTIILGGDTPLAITGAMTIKTGNEGPGVGDFVGLDDVRCFGAVNIDMGAGTDTFALDLNPGAYTSAFAGAFNLQMGAGTDSATIGNSLNAYQKAEFAVAPKLNGGSGTDALFLSNYSIDGVNGADLTTSGFE